MEKIIRNNDDDVYRIVHGLSPKRGPLKKLIDEKNNSLWHYWSLSDNPEKVYKQWRIKLSKDNPNIFNNKGEHPLHILCIKGKEDALNFFLKINTIPENINNHKSLLTYACWSGNINLVQRIYKLYPNLIDIQDEDGLSCLMIAINREKKDIVEFLLNNGINPNLKDKKGKSSLIYAAEKGLVEIKELLEDNGAIEESIDVEEVLEKYMQKSEEETKRYSNFWVNKYLSKIEL